MFLQKYFRILLFVFCCSSPVWLSAHPVHVSVANLEYNEQTKSFDVVIKLFLDDFQEIIRQNYNAKLNLGTPTEIQTSKKFINKYIFNNFKIKINNKEVRSKAIDYNGKKIVDLNIWLYYTIKSTVNITNVQVTNTLMFDLYKDQNNLLIFTFNDLQDTHRFDIYNEKKNFRIGQ